MVESDRATKHMVLESIPLNIKMKLVDPDAIVVSPIVTSRLASPRGGIYLDGDLDYIASSLSKESDEYIDRVLSTSSP